MSIYFHQDTLILDRSILIKDMEEIFFKIYIFKFKKLIRFIIANSVFSDEKQYQCGTNNNVYSKCNVLENSCVHPTNSLKHI